MTTYLPTSLRTVATKSPESPFLLKTYQELDLEQLVIDAPMSRVDLKVVESDDEITNVMLGRIAAIKQIDWYITHPSAEIAKTLTALMAPFVSAIIDNQWSAVNYGYAVSERVYQVYKDGPFAGLIGYKTILSHPFEWFYPDQKGDFYLRRTSQIGSDGILLDTTHKYLTTVNRPTSVNPRGEALIAKAFWPWFYRKLSWQFRMIFLERLGQPILVGVGDNTAIMAKALADSLQSAVAAVPPNSDVSNVSVTGNGELFDSTEEALVQRIQRLYLGQTLTSGGGSGGSGSRSLGEVHMQVRTDRVLADIELLAPCLNQATYSLAAFNFPNEVPPVFSFVTDRGLAHDRAVRDQVLTSSGRIKFTAKYYKDKFGFEEDHFEIVEEKEEEKPNTLPPDDNRVSPDNDGEA